MYTQTMTKVTVNHSDMYVKDGPDIDNDDDYDSDDDDDDRDGNDRR